jgi:signal transduction histidine kinase
MTARREAATADLRHELNNLFTKILGAADLALLHPCAPLVRSELETIVGLVQEGGGMVKRLSAP